jgi:L-iditol 2-dehydrogenase
VKGAGGKPRIAHELDLNNQVHYQLQCYQATHGSTMRGITLAHRLISDGRLPKLGLMTGTDERFRPDQLLAAIQRASSSDSLKVIVDWD